MMTTSRKIRLAWLFAPIFALILTAAADAADDDSFDMELSFVDGRLSLEAEQVPLQAVLEAVASSAGFTIELRGEVTEAVSLSIRDLPIHSAIGELLSDSRHSFFLQFAAREPGQTSARLASLVVIAAGPGGGQAGTGQATVEPERDPPAPRPDGLMNPEDPGMQEAIEILGRLLGEDDALLREAAAEALSDLDRIAATN